MPRRYSSEVNPSEIMLENILIMMSGFTFGKHEAAKIVGGRKKLENLIAEGKIDAVKPTNVQNGKWFCNAAHVLKHCRNMRSKR